MESPPDITRLLIDLQEGRREAFGNTHYYTAAAVINVGTAELALGNFDTAEAHYLEGERIFREIFGPEHAAVAIAHARNPIRPPRE